MTIATAKTTAKAIATPTAAPIVNAPVMTMACCEGGCNGTMEGRKGEYRYVESGLDSVVLKNILVFHCTTCNEVVPEIPAVGLLHRVIAFKLLLKKALLTGDEIRFLRKFCGYSVADFAEIMGSTKSVISRWETQTHGASTDRTIRLLVMLKLAREMAGQPEVALKNVTMDELISKVENAFKAIDDRDGAEQRYEISPEDLAQFGSDPSETEMGAVN